MSAEIGDRSLVAMTMKPGQEQTGYIRGLREDFDSKIENLFCMKDHWRGITSVDLKNENEVKSRVGEVLEAGLRFVKACQSEAIEGKGRKAPSFLDYEREKAILERALEVVKGTRSNPESLEDAVSILANRAYGRARIGHEERYRELPGVGFMGLFVSPIPGNKEQSFYTKEQEQIREVSRYILNKAKDWAKKPAKLSTTS